jgi:hypothetical protein
VECAEGAEGCGEDGGADWSSNLRRVGHAHVRSSVEDSVRRGALAIRTACRLPVAAGAAVVCGDGRMESGDRIRTAHRDTVGEWR